jgi:hypothetical protein
MVKGYERKGQESMRVKDVLEFSSLCKFGIPLMASHNRPSLQVSGKLQGFSRVEVESQTN